MHGLICKPATKSSKSQQAEVALHARPHNNPARRFTVPLVPGPAIVEQVKKPGFHSRPISNQHYFFIETQQQQQQPTISFTTHQLSNHGQGQRNHGNLL
jgi:hypothetical protein